MKRKKLLQIWDITCSSAIIAGYLEDHGWQCKVIMRESFDKHDCSKSFRDYQNIPGRARKYYGAIVRAILSFKPNLILVRQNYQVIPLVKLFAPRTPLIVHFHGLEVRYRKTIPWQAKLAEIRLASTRDILRFGEFYATPIHPMYSQATSSAREKGTALFIRGYLGIHDGLEAARKFAEDNGLELDVIDRTKGEHIPHTEMPELLAKYEWYLDLKGHTTREVISKTAIEFLTTAKNDSIGKVLTDDGDVITSESLDYYITPLNRYLELFESAVK
ncbi:MAG: hypothetical protein ACFFAY_15785 [Promethearchaeota archaeon]